MAPSIAWPRLARAAVLLLLAVLLARDLDAPFLGWHEMNSAMYSQFARNHLQYGLAYTKGYSTWGDTAEPPAVPQRYLNHPPLLALWTAVPIGLLGDHEWTARLVPVAATLGSAAILMGLVGRLAGPLVGVLSGLFFSILPLTLQFGRMVDHVAPVQFFSLVMVRGYLEWNGSLAGRRRGAAVYVAGAVLGIGTGWGALLAAGLVFGWHALSVARGRGDGRLLPWLAGVPALALAGVVLHILAASGWDLGMLPALFGGRSLGGAGGSQPLIPWLGAQWVHFERNFTLAGAIATALAPLLLRGPVVPPVAVLGLQGLLYVGLFKNAAWHHDYWQFFLSPLVAVSLAAAAAAAHAAVRARSPRAGPVALALVVASPLPGTARSLSFYGQQRQPFADHVPALVRLGELVPERAPVFTSRRWDTASERIGGYTSRWPNPVIAYYANRPLLYSRDPAEVEANRPGCAAYLLTRRDAAWAREIETALSRARQPIPVPGDQLVFLLR